MAIFNEKAFRQIAQAVEEEYQMGGLSGGLYYDYARDICKRYLKEQESAKDWDARSLGGFAPDE